MNEKKETKAADLGRCPQCGSRKWIEETTWDWMFERWAYTTGENTSELSDGKQIKQDGSCQCTYKCAACGWEIPEGSESGGGTSSWDEYWGQDDNAEDEDVKATAKELTKGQLDRQDEVESQIHTLLETLAGKELDFEINAEMIANVRDTIEHEFEERGIMSAMEFYPYLKG